MGWDDACITATLQGIRVGDAGGGGAPMEEDGEGGLPGQLLANCVALPEPVALLDIPSRLAWLDRSRLHVSPAWPLAARERIPGFASERSVDKARSSACLAPACCVG